MKPVVWIVEMFLDEPKVPKQWVPTTEAALCREDARAELKYWQLNNPTDRFRVACYERKS